MSAARITPGGVAEVGIVNWLIARIGGRVSGTNPPGLFLTMARQPKLFRGWLRFAGRLMPRGTLPRRDTELVILRVASLNDCAYELAHHRRIATKSGLSEAEVERVIAGDLAGWPDRERVLLEAVDSLHRQRDLDDETWARLGDHLDEPAVVELLLLAGHYEMLATFLNTVRVDVDAVARVGAWL
jgi:AhpD family alkylhydroperoxidase